MDAQVYSPEERARAAREHAAAQQMLDFVVGMTAEEAVTAVALALATLCAGIAQDNGSNAEGAASLVRRTVGCAERHAKRNFGRVRTAPMGRC